ncbi:hypothetical protein [Frankia sp. Cas3]|uniref:hypothetical protein n=1 Tax=Frankia sp. Cas3 TaxID=3073926 RepID=UPI002AD1EC95|nr:hypothetical protein [Frankia sp. Cas3]
MTTVGFSGHQKIPEQSVAYIIDGMARHLHTVPRPLIGLTSLAAGADQMFARLVLELGGSLRLVIPSQDYLSTFETDDDRASFQELVRQDLRPLILNFDVPSEDAFFAAGRAVVEGADEMLVVWDGLPARGLGGTADVIGYAAEQGKPVTVVWPPGQRR